MRKLFLFVLMCLSLTSWAQNKGGAAQNAVLVQADGKPVKFNPMLFGQFIEHFDRQIYGGIYQPGNPLSDEDGFRKDVIEAVRELRVPIVRWPGGCFVSSYHWYYGVGPERTPVWDKTWQVEEPNTFGTDEFVKWCRKAGCEPYICTNAGTGSMEEMSDWVEYCNLSAGKWGRQRIANGFAEPHNVKYWSIGNENWGGHELGAKTVEEWGHLVCESAKLMLSVQKDLKLFAAALPDRKWTLPLLKTAGQWLDYVSIHGYWDPQFAVHNPSPYLDCMMMCDGPEESINRTIDILNEAGYGGGKIKIAFDEWNLRNWHHPVLGGYRQGFDYEARRKNDIASVYTMADAVFSACFLNSCLRHADVVDIACFSPIVNVRGPLFVYPEGILRRTTYYVLWMYANELLPYVVPVKTNISELSNGKKKTSVLDVVLTADEARSHYVCAVANKDPQKALPLTLDFEGMKLKAPRKVRALILEGKSPDDYNDIGDEHVKPQEQQLPVKDGQITLPPHSISLVYL